MTTDPAPVAKKFGPVHRWGKVQLGWLDVNYSPTTLYRDYAISSALFGCAFCVTYQKMPTMTSTEPWAKALAIRAGLRLSQWAIMSA